jgi:DNA-binding response OmpR family regulator
MVESGGIHLVLTDLMVPSMKGLELCRWIRDGQARDVPVVALTDACDRKHLCQAFDAGACDCVVKPIHLDEVVARVRSVLRAREEIALGDAKERWLVDGRLEARNRELLRLSALDQVTSLANRCCVDQTLGRVWRSCCGTSRSWHSSWM